MNILEKLEKKKILILGFGREGQSTYKFLRKIYPNIKLAICDKKKFEELGTNEINIINNDSNLECYWGGEYLNKLDQFEIIIKSPGIPNKLMEIQLAKEIGVEFTSQTKIFLELCKGTIVGVTGTKGKSTTTSLIYNILKIAKIRTVILGNIGKPPLDYLVNRGKDTYYIFEMSSHQLADVEKSPHIAVFLNIFPEHLDYYLNYEDYFQAKVNIMKYQKPDDYIIYNADIPKIDTLASDSKAQKYKFSFNSEVENGCFLRGENIVFTKGGNEEFIFYIGRISLIGEHNLYNVMAAMIASIIVGVDYEDLEKGMARFKPLEGRLEKVGVYNSVLFVNDTLATIPDATIAALKSFEGKNLTLILGGFDRGVDFDTLGKDLSNKENVMKVILVGQTAPIIKKSLKKYKYKGEIYDMGTSKMSEVVKFASKISERQSVVLLSPASTSFDMFNDYKDRGDQFKKAVLELSA